ncbi:unnamed protein product, partial [Cyprideis torosa]
MSLAVEAKKEIFQKFGKSESDTGSAEGQIALFTQRISDLSKHLEKNRKDFNTEKALVKLVGKRKSLLNYLKNKDIERYRAILGPISEVRVVRVDGQLMINPDEETLAKADLDIMVGASEDSVVMVEGEMDEISEQDMIEAIRYAHEEIKAQIVAQKALALQVGKSEPKRSYEQK